MKLRFLSYNIDSGRGTDNRFNPMRSLREIRALQPDIAAVQEVAVNRPDAPPEDYPSLAAETLGMQVLFAESLGFSNGGAFGVMLASRFPLEKTAELVLPVPETAEPRRALIAKVLCGTPFYAVSTHFSFQGECDEDDEVRRASAQTIHDYVTDNRLFPCVLLGDLNAAPDAPAIRLLREKGWKICNDAGTGAPTAETGKFGWMEIDYIAVFPGDSVGEHVFRRGEKREASDHYCIRADMELEEPGEAKR